MSATNRGSKRSEADFYPTPAWCVHRLLEQVRLPGGVWLEPSAGRGAIISAVNAVRDDIRWEAIELMKRYQHPLIRLAGPHHVRIGDFLSVAPKALHGRPSVIVTNPPFSLAMPIIEHTLDFRADVVVMLLRLNFLASDARADFMRRHAPDVFVLPNRPSFSGAGTDSIEYAWFVWHGSRRRRNGRVHVLATTPSVERLHRRRAPKRR